jgi:hypothetical protein
MERKRDLSCIKLVCRNDDAIKNRDAYDSYLKSLDESELQLSETPSRLILNLELKGSDAEKIKNAMMGGTSAEGAPAVALGTWQFTVARLTLKGIENPPELPLEEQVIYKQNVQGKPADETLAYLDRIGAVADIFACYQAQVLTATRSEAKKS